MRCWKWKFRCYDSANKSRISSMCVWDTMISMPDIEMHHIHFVSAVVPDVVALIFRWFCYKTGFLFYFIVRNVFIV